MIKIMQESYNKAGSSSKIFVTDLAQACATKSNAEVTKDFVNAASFILRATVEDGKA